METGYIVRFYDVGDFVSQKWKEEIDAFFHTQCFYVPVLPFAGMVFDLSSFVEHSGRFDLNEAFEYGYWAEVGSIIFCQNHIDILLNEIQDHLPFHEELDYRTFPPHNQRT